MAMTLPCNIGHASVAVMGILKKVNARTMGTMIAHGAHKAFPINQSASTKTKFSNLPEMTS
eukprot:4696251-Ditylum_brightwellii.AAC.1